MADTCPKCGAALHSRKESVQFWVCGSSYCERLKIFTEGLNCLHRQVAKWEQMYLEEWKAGEDARAENAKLLKAQAQVLARNVKLQAIMQLLHALPIEHDENRHAFKRIKCFNMNDLGAIIADWASDTDVAAKANATLKAKVLREAALYFDNGKGTAYKNHQMVAKELYHLAAEADKETP